MNMPMIRIPAGIVDDRIGSLMSAEDFDAWIKQAEHGEVVVYYRGFLAADRFRFSAVAAAAQKAHERECVCLTQRRVGAVGDAVWDYQAHRC